MKTSHRTKTFSTIDEIKRDYQASAAFRFLIDDNRILRNEIGAMKSYILELENDLKNFPFITKATELYKNRTIQVASLNKSIVEYKKKYERLKEDFVRLKKERDEMLNKIIQINSQHLTAPTEWA